MGNIKTAPLHNIVSQSFTRTHTSNINLSIQRVSGSEKCISFSKNSHIVKNTFGGLALPAEELLLTVNYELE